MPTYGSVDGVASYVRHMTFDGDNNPSTVDVATWLEQRSARLTAWLAAEGYTTPVTAADYSTAKMILDQFANLGAAGDAELSMRSAGFDADDQNRRENKFFAEFAKAEAWIAGGALESLGVPKATTTVPTSGLSFVTANYGVTTTTDEYSRGYCD